MCKLCVKIIVIPSVPIDHLSVVTNDQRECGDLQPNLGTLFQEISTPLSGARNDRFGCHHTGALRLPVITRSEATW